MKITVAFGFSRSTITPAAYDAIIATLTDDPSYSVNLCFLEK